MKKMLYLFLVICMFTLTGCEMPFTPPKKTAVVNYVDIASQSVKASQEIDKSLVSQLEKIKMGDDTKKIKKQIVLYIKEQQDLYDNIKQVKAPVDNPKLKYIYLNDINQKIISYENFREALRYDNYDTLQKLLKEHKTKVKEMDESALMETNYVLDLINEKERKKLEPANEK